MTSQNSIVFCCQLNVGAESRWKFYFILISFVVWVECAEFLESKYQFHHYYQTVLYGVDVFVDLTMELSTSIFLLMLRMLIVGVGNL